VRVSGVCALPTLVDVSTPEDGDPRFGDPAEQPPDELDEALAAAVANAAVDGEYVEADEQALIRLYQRGGLTREEFLRRARAMAIRKAAEDK
jgi:hypothetical protein